MITLVCTIKNYEIISYYIYLCSTKSVKFWRENPANEHSISSGKYRLQKIREIRSSQFIVDCSRVRNPPPLFWLVWSTVAQQDCRLAEKINQKYPKHCAYLIFVTILAASLLFMLWITCDLYRFLLTQTRVLSRASLSFLKARIKY